MERRANRQKRNWVPKRVFGGIFRRKRWMVYRDRGSGELLALGEKSHTTDNSGIAQGNTKKLKKTWRGLCSGEHPGGFVF